MIITEKYLDRAEFAQAKLEEYCNEMPNKRVSDVGAGFGHMQNGIEGLGLEWQPFDYVKKIEMSINWDLNEECPIEYKAGTVVLLEVLEHLANPLLGIQNIANHMELGGVLILAVPNPEWSKNRINLLVKGTLYAFQEKHLIEHHVFTPWFHIVRFFLEKSGFELLEYAIIDSKKSHKPKNSKERLKREVEKFIERRNLKAKGMSYGLVAQKK